jgi:CheY-like chemotaxis protein
VKDTPEPAITITAQAFNAGDSFLHQYPEIASHKLVHIRITDNGCGIDPSIRERVFEPFFTTREVGKGTGLGLPMAYGCVRSIGGAIDIQNTSGQGTSVDIYLPTKAATFRVEDISGEVLKGHGETIMVVDDEVVVRMAETEVLAGIGYQVVEAQNGKEAVELFEQHQNDIDLVMMDVIMPVMGGVKAAKRIRKIRPDIPILFATGYDLSGTLGHELNIGESDTIFKPFQVSLLSQTLHRLLQKSGKPKKPKRRSSQPKKQC